MAKARILISYFFGSDTIPLGDSCARAFESMGHEVYRFHSQVSSPWEQYFFKWLGKLVRGLGCKGCDPSRNAPWGNDASRARALEKAVKEFRPDIVLVIRGNSFSKTLLQRLKSEYGVKKTIGWWVKEPRDNGEMQEDATRYDSYFCIHTHGYVEGQGIHHLPALGVDSTLYYPAREVQPTKHDVVLVGGWSKRRQQYLEAIADLPLEIWGPGWRKRGHASAQLQSRVRGSKIWGDELIRLYHTSKIVLNVTSWETGKKSGQNLRLFDVPACGAFLLTDAAPELETYYKIGEEIETFSTPDSLRQKLQHYLAHPERIVQVAAAGGRKAATLETYMQKMQRILAMATGEKL